MRLSFVFLLPLVATSSAYKCPPSRKPWYCPWSWCSNSATYDIYYKVSAEFDKGKESAEKAFSAIMYPVLKRSDTGGAYDRSVNIIRGGDYGCVEDSLLEWICYSDTQSTFKDLLVLFKSAKYASYVIPKPYDTPIKSAISMATSFAKFANVYVKIASNFMGLNKNKYTSELSVECGLR